MSTMNPGGASGSPYRLPPEPSRWSAITLAVLQLAATLCDDPDIAAGADKGGKGKWFGLWSAKAKT